MGIIERFRLFGLSVLAAAVLCGCSEDAPVNDVPDVTYSISVAERMLGFRADEPESKTVAVAASDVAWKYEVAQDGRWCNATVGGDERNPAIEVSVKENTGEQSRTAKIYVRLFDASDSITVTQTGIVPCVVPERNEYDIDSHGGVINVGVTANVDFEVSCDASWLSADRTSAEGKVVLAVQPNDEYEPRKAEVEFDFADGRRAAAVTVTQQAAVKPEIPETNDYKIEITDISGVEAASASPLSYINDADLTTAWQTPSAGTYAPAEIRFALSETPRVDYMVYYPAAPYGQFGEVDVYCTSAAGIETFVCSHDFGMKDSPDTIRFSEDGIVSPRAVILKVKSLHGRESTPASRLLLGAAEIEFYRTAALKHALEIFTDYSCSELLPSITAESLPHITDTLLRRIATGLADGTYRTEYRIAEYKAYRNPTNDNASFRTDRPYSRFDNVTGMMIPAAGTYRVMVSDVPDGVQLKMSVVDYNTNENGQNCDYNLKKGINTLEIRHTGLIYIQYHSEAFASLPRITVHFPDATVNGYYDMTVNDPLDFRELIYDAPCDHFDMIGRRVMMTYPVTALKQYTVSGKRANELLELADTIISLTEEFQGFYKYQGRGRYNRLLIRPIYNVGTANMYATNYSIAFRVSTGTIRNVADPTSLKNNIWGPAHEVGHMNAVTKSMNWAGCNETMPNLSAAYVDYMMNGGLERKATTLFNTREENSPAKSCYYDMIYRDFMIPHRPYLLEGGYTEMRYERVIPFWQLHLYASFVKGYPDFYKDLYNHMRDNNQVTDAEAQMQFVKVACDLLEENLTEFFEAYGFLTPLKNFYAGSRLINITEQMIEQTKQHISQYSEPALKIQFINETNIDAFRSSEAPVAGTAEIQAGSYVCKGWSGIAVWELADADGKTLAYSAKPEFKYGINPLFWADIDGNANPAGNENTQKYCYLNRGEITTATPEGAVVYGITPTGERVAATAN